MTISDLEGVGEVQAAKLGEAGIKTVEGLLENAKSASGRSNLAEKTGISEKTILEWVNRADLYRIKGIGSEISDLLEAAGVDSVLELANRNPENLVKALEDLNTQKKLVRSIPTISEITGFINQAKSLDKVVTH